MARVILELKSALEKGTTTKDVTGGATSTSSAPQMGGFGIGSFISSGGIVGKEQTVPTLRNEDVSLPSTKTCKEFGTVLPFKARFCSKCGPRTHLFGKLGIRKKVARVFLKCLRDMDIPTTMKNVKNLDV
jgi:hypothetical protein